MSLNTEITRIENAKEDIKDAIEEMGGEVGEGTIDTYATAVRSIQTGVGTETDPVFTNSPAYGITSNDITNWNGKSTFSGSYNDLTNKPTIPTKLSDLSDDSTHRTVSDTEKTTWNNKGTYSKPTNGIPKSDLANDVQTSLGKADTALQSYTEQYTGTITGITMNGVSKGTSGVVDLGTVITSHQDITGKEDISNKVTSLSSNSTDTQYPSAKCVYDLVGNISTVLASLVTVGGGN